MNIKDILYNTKDCKKTEENIIKIFKEDKKNFTKYFFFDFYIIFLIKKSILC